MRALLLCLSLALATPAVAFPKDFDGDWTVEARTTVGDCAPEVSGTVRIEGGRVVASSAEGVAVWGYIDEGGAIAARFTTDQHMARANGKLKGAAGTGAWSSNTNYCGGVWKARREK